MYNFYFDIISDMNYLDVSYKAATVLIALFNVVFAYKLFKLKDKKDEESKEKDRKIQLLKILVLDHNMNPFYTIFESMEQLLEKLNTPTMIEKDKQSLINSIEEIFISLRRKFYGAILAIDFNLYNEIEKTHDDLQEYLVNTISDRGINLSHKPKYEEMITEKIIESKANIIKILYLYRG